MKNFLKNLILAFVMMIFCLSAFAVDPATPVNPVPAPVQSNFMLWFGVVMTCLFAISEALGSIPAIKENGIFQIIVKILNAFAVKKQEEKAAMVKARETNKIPN